MKFVLALLIGVSLFGMNNAELERMSVSKLVKNSYYTYVCENRWKYINKYRGNDDILSLVAYACLKKRFLIPALDVAKVLTHTKEGRKNATYISTLFLIKKLMIQILNNDDIDVRALKLPKILDNSLGMVFGMVQEGRFTRNGKNITVILNGKKYVVSLNKEFNVVIETFVDESLIKRETYW